MIKIIFYIFLIFCIGCVSNSEESKNLKVNPDSLHINPEISVTIMTPERLALQYIDSSNNFREGDSIPSFFYNYLLDYQNPWNTFHQEFSIRKVVLDSTHNIRLLRKIINSLDPLLKETVDSSDVSDLQQLRILPFYKISNYQLAKERLRELESNYKK